MQPKWTNSWLIEKFVHWLDGGEPMETPYRMNEIVESRREPSDPLDTLTVTQKTRWERQGLTVDRLLWKVRPMVSWEGEAREVSAGTEMVDGDRYRQYRDSH